MYLAHFGLETEPFKITPNTKFFYSGTQRGEILEALLYAITTGEGIIKVVGEVGSGKTMICRMLDTQLPKSVVSIHILNPSMGRDEILNTLATELGVSLDKDQQSHSIIRVLQENLIQRYSDGQQVIVFIDEAQAMPIETLEEVRLLSNLETDTHKLLQIVMLGQPELDEQLADPAVRQLRERITYSFFLAPFAQEAVREYIALRLKIAGYRGPDPFSDGAIKLISKYSHGIIRRINILADKSLLAAYASGSHTVSRKEIRSAIQDSQIKADKVGRTRVLRRYLYASSVAAALLVGVFVADWLQPGMRNSLSDPAAESVVQTMPDLSESDQSAERVGSRPEEVEGPDPQSIETSDLIDRSLGASTELAAQEIVQEEMDGLLGAVQQVNELASASIDSPEGESLGVIESFQSDEAAELNLNPGAESVAELDEAASLEGNDSGLIQIVEWESLQNEAEPDIPVQGQITPSMAELVAQAETQPMTDEEAFAMAMPVPPTAPLLERRRAATAAWLRATPRDYWTLQIVTAQNLDEGRRLLEWVNLELGTDELFVYYTGRPLANKYAVSYGSFASASEANMALAQISDEARRYGAYPRLVNSISSLNQEFQ